MKKNLCIHAFFMGTNDHEFCGFETSESKLDFNFMCTQNTSSL